MKPYLLFVFLVHAFFYSTVLSESVSPLKMIKPGKVGMDAEKLKLVDQKMEELIKEERLAGGIVVVARKGKVKIKTVGRKVKKVKIKIKIKIKTVVKLIQRMKKKKC